MQGRLKLWVIAIAALVLGGLFALLSPKADPTLTFLSVGQGDCAVFTSGGTTVLIDVGPRSETYDSGERIIAPKLRSRGLGAIDLIILSHPDLDHIGGLGFIFKHFQVGKIAINRAFRGHPVLKAVLDQAGLTDSEIWWLGPETRVQIGPSVLRILCPNLPPGANDNDGSAFVHIQCKGSSALLTGDAPGEVELAMLARYDLRAKILKAGHHGSAGSTCFPLLRKVNPKHVVMSCGADNPYGHPNEVTIRRVQAVGATIWRTDRQGDLQFRFSPAGLETPPR